MRNTGTYTGPERRATGRTSRVAWLLDPVYGLLRWIGEHVSGFHAAVGTFLLVGLGLILGAVVLFTAVAALMTGGLTQRVDEAILLWMNAHSTPLLYEAALEVTALAGVAVVLIILLLASAFFWVTNHRYSVLLLWVAYAGGSLITFTLKAMFNRPRPALFEWDPMLAGHSSFPSGHSSTAVGVFATLAYLIVRLEPTRRLRRLTLALAAVVILLVGASRMYLGVHYPSDVLAGFMLGLAWATFCALGIEAIRYFRSRRPEVVREEEDLEKGTEPIQDAVTSEAHPG